MNPIKFKEQNCIIAEYQPEYIPIPAYKVKEPAGRIIFCMKISLREKVALLFKGKIWASFMMFNKPMTPSFFTTQKKEVFENTELKE